LIWRIALLFLALTSAAAAQTLLGVTSSPTGGGSPAPPTCSNKLDFSQACNSQYLGFM